MATFSTNQFRHLYVAKALKNDKSNPLIPTTLNEVGDIAISGNMEGTHIYFRYMSPGGLTRSDLIAIKNIEYVKHIPASDMRKALKAFKVTLDPEVNAGNPIAGQDYILRIAFSNYVGISEEDQYFKYGMVHAYAGMDASTFYKKLAISLAKNFSREPENLLKFDLLGEEDIWTVRPSTKEEDLDDNFSGILITELEQPWVRGKKAQVSLNFNVFPTTVTFNGDEVVWGKVESVEYDGPLVCNGKIIADMEYFYMGERGDIYRDMGAPNTYDTQYLVDPNEEYDVLEIHYSYIGSNESVQKSEKDITIVGDAEVIGALYDWVTQVSNI